LEDNIFDGGGGWGKGWQEKRELVVEIDVGNCARNELTSRFEMNTVSGPPLDF